MKKVWFLIVLLISGLWLTWCKDISINEYTEILFTWNLREDYQISYTIKWTPEFFYDEKWNSQLSGWEYTINIDPIDNAYKYEKQAMTVNFKSNIRLNHIIESDSEDKIVKLPQFWITITNDTVEMENNFWIYCPSRDWDNFVNIPWWKWTISDKTVERDNNQYIFDAYNFIWPTKYINHYKKWNISMFYERWNWSGLIIDDSELFSQNCMIEIWEIEDFLPLELPFELNFNNFEYTTIWFIKELSDNSDCLSSHEINSPHNNYMSFFTENLACQLWYETWITLEKITFENRNLSEFTGYKTLWDDNIQKFVWVNQPFSNPQYEPSDLVYLQWLHHISAQSNHQLRKEAALHLEEMATDFYKEFWTNIVIASAYRSYRYQKNSISESCKKSWRCAREWESEHQLGLAVDLWEASNEEKFLSKYQTYYDRLQENAHKYWFHQSYQNWRTIDGYYTEPRHRRYLWKKLATTLYENNQTFTQYVN